MEVQVIYSDCELCRGKGWIATNTRGNACEVVACPECQWNYIVELEVVRERAEAAEAEIREILAALKAHCQDDFVVITDGAYDWRGTIAEFVSFVRLGENEN